jgi:hypothetical protein
MAQLSRCIPRFQHSATFSVYTNPADRAADSARPAISSISTFASAECSRFQRSVAFSVYTNAAGRASSRAADSARPAIPSISSFASAECSLILRWGEPIWTVERYLLQG